MAAKKRGRPKKSASAQTAQAKRTVSSANTQLLSVIWFAVAIFVAAVVILPGENVWNLLHKFCLGFFGVTAYFYPVLLGVVAVFCRITLKDC